MDYLVGILLIAAPWIFDFARGGAETWVPVVVGAGTIMYSLLTDYEYGAAHMFSMRAHLTMDLLGGIVLAASPWLFGFSEYVYAPHLIVGLFEIGTSLMTHTVPSTEDRRAHTRRPGHAH